MTTTAPTHVPVTFAKKEVFTERDFRRHAGKLADKIESLPREFHRQGSWAAPANNACGTTGCALGIAALSHMIPGLQFKVTRRSTRGTEYRATIDGRLKTWTAAGERFFGRVVHRRIFAQGWLSREDVIARLRNYANTGSVL